MLTLRTPQNQEFGEKTMEFFSTLEFSPDSDEEKERVALLHTANEFLKGNKSGLDLWRHFDNLSKMKLPPHIHLTVLNFREIRGYF